MSTARTDVSAAELEAKFERLVGGVCEPTRGAAIRVLPAAPSLDRTRVEVLADPTIQGTINRSEVDSTLSSSASKAATGRPPPTRAPAGPSPPVSWRRCVH